MPSKHKALRVQPRPPKVLSYVKGTARQDKRALATNSTAWRGIRAGVLRDEPLCRLCHTAHRLTVATQVDHIDGDSHNNSRENLQALCAPCHSRKTAREDGGFGNFRGGG